MSPTLITLVVPVFNEIEALVPFMASVREVLDNRPEFALDILFVNDGSTDDTLQQLLLLRADDPRIRVIDLSRRFGKEAALSAGLADVRGDVVVPIDVDLQDPPALIPDMLAQWRAGFEVVLARRVDRSSDHWLKRNSASWFYRLHNWVADMPIPPHVGDFRLMDRAVVEAINQLPESRRFMKGLFSWAGFKTTTLDYVRAERVAAGSRFTTIGLLNLALESVTSFSTAPLRLWLYAGSVLSLLALVFATFIVIKVLLTGVDVPGYASLMVAVTLLGGVQLIGIGVLGEYLGRTYFEAKRRPAYLIRRKYETAPDTKPAVVRKTVQNGS